jgi:hypothetical protein
VSIYTGQRDHDFARAQANAVLTTTTLLILKGRKRVINMTLPDNVTEIIQEQFLNKLTRIRQRSPSAFHDSKRFAEILYGEVANEIILTYACREANKKNSRPDQKAAVTSLA